MKAWAAIVLLLPLGCMSAPGGTTVAGYSGGCKGADCTRASGPARSGSGSSSGGSDSSASSSVAGSSTPGGTSSATTVSSARSSSGSSGGSSTATAVYSCETDPLPDGGGCANGSFVSQTVDLLSCDPIVGATVQSLDANGVPASGSVTTASDGTFVLCAPPGKAFTPYITASGYATVYRPELQGGEESSSNYLVMISTSDLTAIGAFLPGGLDNSLGTVIAYVSSNTVCPDDSGWVVSLSYGDGGTIPDGGYFTAYLGPSGVPQPGATATTERGIAFLYDVDLSATNYFSLHLAKADAGGCAPIVGTAFYTGRIYLTVNALSIESYEVP